MNRRRLVFGSFFLTPLAVVAACSFPTVTFSPEVFDGSTLPDGAKVPEGSVVLQDGRVVEQDTGTTPPADAGPDVFDATPPTQRPDAALPDGGTAPCNCDCDNDGYATGPQLGDPACKPGHGSADYDCDDNDPNAYPNEPNYLTLPPVSPTYGNWDCTGGVQMEYDSGIACGNYSTSLFGLDCTTVSGYEEQQVDCGAPGTLVTCKNPGLGGTTCLVNTTTNAVLQGCK